MFRDYTDLFFNSIDIFEIRGVGVKAVVLCARAALKEECFAHKSLLRKLQHLTVRHMIELAPTTTNNCYIAFYAACSGDSCI
jgi:hypothetical protein